MRLIEFDQFDARRIFVCYCVLVGHGARPLLTFPMGPNCQAGGLCYSVVLLNLRLFLSFSRHLDFI